MDEKEDMDEDMDLDEDVDHEAEADVEYTYHDEYEDVEPPVHGKSDSVRCMLHADVLSIMDSDASKLCAQFGVSAGHALMLLERFRWNYEQAHAAVYCDSDLLKPLSTVCPAGSGECCICFDSLEEDGGGVLVSECRHSVCAQCWADYLECCLKELSEKGSCYAGGRLFRIMCPTDGCACSVDVTCFNALGDQRRADVEARKVKSFVEHCRFAFWCSEKHCDRVLLSPINEPCVKCSNCGTSACGDCHRDCHQPVNCAEQHKWTSMLEMDKSLLESTKCCPNPKCGALTQKTGGCLFISCRACNHFWCWSCGDYSPFADGVHHVYNCYKPDNSKLSMKSDLSRLMFYKKRFNEHMDSLKMHETVLREKVEKAKQAVIAERNAGSVCVASPFVPVSLVPLDKAMDLVVRCRTVLAWCNAYAYFMDVEDPSRHLFEYSQEFLETFTEKLCFQLNENCTTRDAMFFREFEIQSLLGPVRTYLDNLLRDCSM